MKAIVLCGGLGTRLGKLTLDTPKPMLAVAGRPFISYVLDLLVSSGISEIVLAAGFQWEKLQSSIGSDWGGVPVNYAIEAQPLGTGGAIKAAFLMSQAKDALVVNGDTLFNIDLRFFMERSRLLDSDISLALRQVDDCSRYGKVTIGESGRILTFGEKGQFGPGYINGGVYFLKEKIFDDMLPTTFSFETDFLAIRHSTMPMIGLAFNSYFIDIGIPADFERAQVELLAPKQK